MTSVNYASILSESFYIKVFGKKIDDFGTALDKSKLSLSYAAGATFVMIYGASIEGECIRFPRPILALVPGLEVDPDRCGYDPKEFRMWNIQKDSHIVLLEHKVGSAHELLRDIAGPTPRPTYTLHDFHLDGTVIRGKIRLKLVLHFEDPTGAIQRDDLLFDGDVDVAFEVLKGQITFSWNGADVKIWYDPSKNAVCASVGVSVGPWHWDWPVPCYSLT
jgi:hypothetical protein